MFHATIFYFLNSLCSIIIFCELKIVAILISCLCHGIRHLDKTNTRLINKCDSFILLYNDRSVLENHHVSVADCSAMNSSSVNTYSGSKNYSYSSDL